MLEMNKGDSEDLSNFWSVRLLPQLQRRAHVLSRTVSPKTWICEQQAESKLAFAKATQQSIIYAWSVRYQKNARSYTSVSRVLDYKKAFDSMEISVVLKALNTIGINPEYIDLLQELNVDGRTEIKDVSRPHQYL